VETRHRGVFDLKIGVGAAAHTVYSQPEINQRILQPGGFDKELGHAAKTFTCI
jgi:hypothetical protein